MTPALATFIVPGRDVAPYVPAALESLRGQTDPRWRAVLIDDHSHDATGTLFDAAARDDERFTVVHLAPSSGLGAARNVGLEHVNTRYVGFLDADDELTPIALAAFLEALESSGSDFAIGAYTRLRPQPDGGYEESTVQPWVAAATAPARRGTTLAEHPGATASIVAWAKLTRTEFWGDTRFPEGRLYEDQSVSQQLLARAHHFDTIPDVVVRWRVRPDGSSITQREAEVDVLRDCLDAMRAGLGALTHHPTAVAARAHLIATMDIPRLATIAEHHPDETYRQLLGAFAREIAGRVTDDEAAAALSVPMRW